MGHTGKRLCIVMAVAASVALATNWIPMKYVKLQQTAHASVTRNRLATNRLATNRLATNRLATNRLATNSLSSNRLSANMATADLLATADGREVYSYLISCALPAGVSIAATITGAPDSAPPDTNYTCASGECVFEGSLGLASDWVDHKLSSKDERWVSACIFARVNLFTQAEGISLRGSHPNLTVSAGEADEFPLEEGAFYGNLFTDEEDPIDWNACRGRDQAEGDAGGLALRDCAEEDPNNPGRTYCGFKYAGDCAAFAPAPSPFACKSYLGGLIGYGACHDSSGEGHWPSSKTYREVITVYVAGG